MVERGRPAPSPFAASGQARIALAGKRHGAVGGPGVVERALRKTSRRPPRRDQACWAGHRDLFSHSAATSSTDGDDATLDHASILLPPLRTRSRISPPSFAAGHDPRSKPKRPSPRTRLAPALPRPPPFPAATLLHSSTTTTTKASSLSPRICTSLAPPPLSLLFHPRPARMYTISNLHPPSGPGSVKTRRLHSPILTPSLLRAEREESSLPPSWPRPSSSTYTSSPSRPARPNPKMTTN
ncbi:uncharacterized protein PFL1_04478 [Pseudozyma flocculosa PF-1]|uniref:Uncharacterized protein n=1 Tax=Pseudozyma flocculosa PF-1 TaxID=1277687 RepID=A0A061HC10_9BASI|nr:uncharacterized protein PFL1_04478 [Pseudozyma flocculosa PF-1]EPQ28151.1 hypothetical protein PFL1_04478 [Pseudozyma flocculosa PF-1]